MIDCGFVEKERIDQGLRDFDLDYRGFLLSTWIKEPDKDLSWENEEKILNFKQLKCENIKSSIPIVDSEVDACSHLLKDILEEDSEIVDRWLQNPKDVYINLASACGHVIGNILIFHSILPTLHMFLIASNNFLI